MYLHSSNLNVFLLILALYLQLILTVKMLINCYSSTYHVKLSHMGTNFTF